MIWKYCEKNSDEEEEGGDNMVVGLKAGGAGRAGGCGCGGI